MPATSASVERLFSVAGQVVTERASSCSHTTTLSIVIETERTVTLCVTADMALVTDRCDMAPSLDAYAHKPKLL